MNDNSLSSFEILDLSGAGELSSPHRGDRLPEVAEFRSPLAINAPTDQSRLSIVELKSAHKRSEPMRCPTTNDEKTEQKLRNDLDAQNREKEMPAEIVRIGRSRDSSENSFQPQAAAERHRRWNVRKRRVD
jgi:hypothetical protein